MVIAEHRLYFLTDLIDQAWYIRQGSLSRRFTREEFQRLTDEERERLGLRTLSSAPCTATGEAGRVRGRPLCGGADLRLSEKRGGVP